MKTKLLLSCFWAIALISSCHVNAQTTIDLYITDSSSNVYCSAPADVFFSGYVLTTGYNNGDSLTIDINFGDGSDTTFKTPIYQNFYASIYLYHLYTSSGFYSVQYIATGPDGNADTLTEIDEVYIGNTCGNLEGRVYADMNNDCVYNAGDLAIEYAFVQAVSNTGNPYYITTYTDNDGYYFLNVPTGLTYDVQIIGNIGNYAIVCPVGGSFTAVSVPSSGLDFAIDCNNGFDLSATMYGFGFVPGWSNSYLQLSLYNAFCGTITGELKVVLDPLTTFSWATIPPSSVLGDTLIWDPFSYDQLTFNTATMLTIYLITSTNAQIGDTVCFTAILEPQVGDTDPSNNIVTWCHAVQSSWDPNEKDVSPKGIIAADQQLTYTIQFQNTGTAPATNIYILDTLENDLNAASFQLVSSSHPCEVTFLGENILKFYFHNINLPDSNTNEQASHGNVVFFIHPADGLEDEMLINNSAAIYFDFNPAVITNTVTNMIDLGTAISEPVNEEVLLVYPNPASESISVYLKDECLNQMVILQDVTGRRIHEEKIEDCHSHLDVSALPSGIYFIRIQNENRTLSTRIFVAR